MKKVAGLILAAGKSQRMGSPKALLEIFDTTFLDHIASEARSSHLYDVKIVLGHEAEHILEKFPHHESEIVINPDYEQGQLSSLVKGLRAIERQSIDGMMLFLIDYPFVRRDLINHLIQCCSETDRSIVIPTFHNRRGHPLVFGRELFSELLSAPLDQGAVAVVRKQPERVLHVEVQDEGILMDIDTPEDYQKFVTHSSNR